MRTALFLVAISLLASLLPSAAADAADKRGSRIVFSATAAVAGDEQIYSIGPSGRGIAQLTVGPGTASDPMSSPDGRWIAFIRPESLSTSIWVMRPNGTGQRKIVARGGDPAWTPDSRRIAYVALGAHGERLGIRVIGADGDGRRSLVSGPVSDPAWSPDGLRLAFVLNDSLVVVRERPERRQSQIVIGGVYDSRLAWSPDGRWLAYERVVGKGREAHVQIVRPDGSQPRAFGQGYRPVWSPNGLLLAFIGEQSVLAVLDVRTGARVTIPIPAKAISWSPDGSRLAYADSSTDEGVIGTVTLGGHRRTLLTAFPDANGVAWTTPPAGLRYRAPLPLNVVAGNELRLRAPVYGIAADGDRVGYHVCNTVGVWVPGQEKIVPVRTQWPLCGYDSSLHLGSLALAGDRIAWAAVQGGNSRSGWLTVAPVTANATQTVVSAPRGRTSGDPRGDLRSGYLLGDDSLLVFTSWAFCDDLGQPCIGFPDRRILSQTLWRVREASWQGVCPLEVQRPPYGLPVGRCQELRIEAGPLRPFDVENGRIVASGDNATMLLDEEGKELLSIPVSADDAQLAGPDLVLLVRGQLRDYDARTGVLLHTWTLPGAPAGVEDAARGLVVYVFARRLHLLRLSDGRDAVIDPQVATRFGDNSPATVARFGDSGLFFSYEAASPWRGRLRFVPFAELPLR